MSLKLLDLPFKGTLSTEVISRILPGASGNQQGASTGTTTDTVLTQLSNIREVMNLGVMATRAVDPPASATGSVRDGQVVAPSGGKGSAPMADLDLTIPHDRGGPMDIEMTGATAGASHDQVPLSLSGGVHRIHTTSLVGIGVDSEDQTAAGAPAGGKGPLTVSTEIDIVTLDEKKGLETSLAQKRPPQSCMVTPGISRHIPSMRLIWHTSTLTWMLSKVSRTPIHTVGVTGKHLCL